MAADRVSTEPTQPTEPLQVDKACSQFLIRSRSANPATTASGTVPRPAVGWRSAASSSDRGTARCCAGADSPRDRRVRVARADRVPPGTTRPGSARLSQPSGAGAPCASSAVFAVPAVSTALDLGAESGCQRRGAAQRAGRRPGRHRPTPAPVRPAARAIHPHPGRPGGPAGVAATRPAAHPRPRQGAGHLRHQPRPDPDGAGPGRGAVHGAELPAPAASRASTTTPSATG